MSTTSLTNVQKQRVIATILGPTGEPKPTDGAPVWLSSDENIVSVQTDADGLGAYIVTTGVVGACFVTLTADVDLGDGVISVTGKFDVEVLESGEVTITFSFDAPEPR